MRPIDREPSRATHCREGSEPTRCADGHEAIHRAATCGEPPQPGVAAVWSLLIRQRWLVLLGAVGGALLAGVYCLLATKVFESEATVLVIKKDPKLPALSAGAGQDSEPTVAEDVLATHLEMLLSPLVVGKALAASGLEDSPAILAALDTDETPVEYVVRSLRVNKGGEGSGRAAHILKVNLHHTSADECKTLLSSLVESYRTYLAETIEQTLQPALEFAETSRDNIEAELQMLRLNRKQLSQGIFWNGEESVLASRDNVQRLVGELRKIREDRINTKARLETILAAQDGADGHKYSDLEQLALIDQEYLERVNLLLGVHGSGPQLQQKEAVTAEFQKLLEYEVEKRKLQSSIYGSEHPRVKRVQTAIEQVEAFLEKKKPAPDDEMKPATLVSAYVALLRSGLSDVERRESAVSDLLHEEQQKAEELAEIEMKDEELLNQIGRQQQHLADANKSVNDLKLAKDYAGFVTEVIAPARIGKQISPKPVLFVAIGSLLGACIGMGLAVVRDQSRREFCDDLDVRSTLGLPVLGRFEVRPSNCTSASGEHSLLDETLVAYHRPASRDAETFRNLRVVVCHPRHHDDMKILQVTSLSSDDGKSTLATNLAITLAQAGKKVLLVDANLRQPRIAELFSIHADRGLSTLLAGDGALDDVLHTTEVDNLSLVPAGPRVTNGSDLLLRPQFSRFLSEAGGEFDIVVVDTPALPASADAIQIASQADGVLLSVDVARTRSDQAVQACETLSSLDSKVLGVVIDASPRPRRRRSAAEIPSRAPCAAAAVDALHV